MGDARAAAVGFRPGTGRGLEIDEELYHQVATFRNGKIVRMEYFAEWDEALEAAGLRG